MSGVKGKSGRPKLDKSNVQLFGYVPEEVALEIQIQAEEEHRSVNNFVGIILAKGWEAYKSERS